MSRPHDESDSVSDLQSEIAVLETRAHGGSAEAEFEYFEFVFANVEQLESLVPKALEMLDSAARKDFGRAQTQLGFMLNTGTVLPQNRELGLYWLLLAAQNGEVDAQRLLGAEFVRRTAIANHAEETAELNTNAIYWLRQAVSKNDVESMSLLGKVLYLEEESREEGFALIKRAADQGSENAKDALRLID